MKLTASEIEGGHPEGCRCVECRIMQESDQQSGERGYGTKVPWWYLPALVLLTGIATGVLAATIVWISGL